LFARQGWFLRLADIDDAALAALAQELGPETAWTCRLDVTREQDWETALAGFFAHTGRLDLLVNDAGILISGPFTGSPLARHHALVEVNIKGVLNGCHHAKAWLLRTPGSRVINLSSASAEYGQASLATYETTKFAVRGLTEALNVEWQADGIRVMDVMPLFVRTSMLQGMDAASARRIGVRLTATDVASVVLKAAQYGGSYGKVHWPVGWMARLLHALGGAGPDRVSRFVARRIAARARPEPGSIQPCGCSAITAIPASARPAPMASQRVSGMPSTKRSHSRATAMYMPP
jgi:NAD(P)-dependent dehydrogenase (short-subunit alcohol dehydrogenase family)